MTDNLSDNVRPITDYFLTVTDPRADNHAHPFK